MMPILSTLQSNMINEYKVRFKLLIKKPPNSEGLTKFLTSWLFYMMRCPKEAMGQKSLLSHILYSGTDFDL